MKALEMIPEGIALECMQLQQEREQLALLQWSYTLHLSRPRSCRLPWMEQAIQGQMTKVRHLELLRSAGRPCDCPENEVLPAAIRTQGRVNGAGSGGKGGRG